MKRMALCVAVMAGVAACGGPPINKGLTFKAGGVKLSHSMSEPNDGVHLSVSH